MAKCLRNVKAAFVGSHRDSDKIPQWLKAHGGSYARQIDDSVTHLIATELALESDAVQKARALDIHIVTYDWLEDSLLAKPPKAKSEIPYLWDRILKERNNKHKVTKRGSETKQKPKLRHKMICIENILGDFLKEARPVVTEMEKLGYHTYVDKMTEVSYSATLVRYALINNRRRKETMLARIYETNKEPHTYRTFVRYRRIGISEDIIAPKGSDLETALSAFKKFFRARTGIDWKDRFDDTKLPPGSQTDQDGKTQDAPEGGWFYFERPKGLMGALSNDAELALEQEADGNMEG